MCFITSLPFLSAPLNVALLTDGVLNGIRVLRENGCTIGMFGNVSHHDARPSCKSVVTWLVFTLSEVAC